MSAYELSVRMAKAGRSLGRLSAELRDRESGDLPAQPLREIGDALRELADTLHSHANEDPSPVLEARR